MKNSKGLIYTTMILNLYPLIEKQLFDKLLWQKE